MSAEAKGLVIRADAGREIGTGHVMRGLALAQAWQDAGGEAVFVSRCESARLKDRLRSHGFGLRELAGSWPEYIADASSTVDVARSVGARWVVVDGYHFDQSYQRSIRDAGFKLLYVDDCNHLSKYAADILLNQNIGAPFLQYRCNSDARLLLGTDYVLLGRQFRRNRPSRHRHPCTARRLLVTMGGSDPHNATGRVLRGLRENCPAELHVRVVVGVANKYRQDLVSVAETCACRVEVLEATDDMPGLMQWADVALSAGGSTCWELLYMGVPSAVLVLASRCSDTC